MSQKDALTKLDGMFNATFKHGGKDASYEEAQHISAQLLAAQRAK